MHLLGWFKRSPKKLPDYRKRIRSYLSGDRLCRTCKPIPLSEYDATVKELKAISTSDKPADIAAADAAQKILAKLPPTENDDSLSPWADLGPSDLEKSEILNEVQIASDPEIVLEKLASSSLSHDDMAALAEHAPDIAEALALAGMEVMGDLLGSPEPPMFHRMEQARILLGAPPRFTMEPPPEDQPSGGEVNPITTPTPPSALSASAPPSTSGDA